MSKITLKSTLPPEVQAKLEKLKIAHEVPKQQEILKAKEQAKEPPQANIKSSHAENSKFAPGKMSHLSKENRAKARERFYITKTWLEKAFPKTFNFREPQPLKLGIQKELFMVSSSFSKTQIRKIIIAYTNSKGYLEATINGQWRYDLNGKKAGQITPDQKEYAEVQLLLKKNRKLNKRRHNHTKSDEYLKKPDPE